MKRCPTCNRTYTQDSQKFCADDGTHLIDDAPAEFDPYKTMMATPAPSPTPTATPPPTPSASQPTPSAELDAFKTLIGPSSQLGQESPPQRSQAPQPPAPTPQPQRVQPQPVSPPYMPPSPMTGRSANQQPVQSAPFAQPNALQVSKRKGAAIASLILGIISLLLTLLLSVTSNVRVLAGSVYALTRGLGFNIPRLLTIFILVSLPVIGLLLGGFGLFRASRQPAKYGGKGAAISGMLVNLFSVAIFALAFIYYLLRFYRII